MSKNQKSIYIILIVLLIFSGVANFFFSTSNNSNKHESEIPQTLTSLNYTPHSFIKAYSDLELVNYASSGNGSVADPYIIEGWNITTNGIHAIEIANVTKAFTIRNCWIDAQNFPSIHGIYIRNVSENIYLSNNVIKNCESGIYLHLIIAMIEYEISNNICFNNQRGMQFEYAWTIGTIVDNNTCYNNGIDMDLYYCVGKYNITNNNCHNSDINLILDNSAQTLLENNTFSYATQVGVKVQNHSDQVTMINNTISNSLGDGVIVDNCDAVTMINNTISNSLGDGVIVSNDVDYFNISFCTIRDNQGNGLQLATPGTLSGNLVMNCTIYGNGKSGILLNQSGYFVIWYNLIRDNGLDGINLNNSDNTYIRFNYFYQNTRYGIYSDYYHGTGSDENEILDNAFVGNNNGLKQAYQADGGLTKWYSGEYGNYWSDWDRVLEPDYYIIEGIGPSDLAIDNSPKETYDYDHDGMEDGREHSLGLSPLIDDTIGDLDEDGLSNYEEYLLGFNAASNDTDGDLMSDSWELSMGLNATDSSDATEDLDDDFLLNIDEFLYDTNATIADSDGDGYIDIHEIVAGSDPNDAEDNPEVQVTETVIMTETQEPITETVTTTQPVTNTETTTETIVTTEISKTSGTELPFVLISLFSVGFIGYRKKRN